MKKTFNINLAGYPFIIDDDAFQMLEDYLETIRQAFKGMEDGFEIVADIESRFAELLLEHETTGVRIVTIDDVRNVIGRIGKPEQIIEENEGISLNNGVEEESIGIEEEKEFITPPPYIPPTKKKFNFNFRKKLFRDPQNALLGGVCSGLAYYFNIDPTLMRILIVLLTLLSATTVGIAYIILWIIVPEARTPIQRMEMMGEEPTMENIGKTVTENYSEKINQNQTEEVISSNSFGSFISNFFSICLKILVLIGLVLGVIVLVGLVLGLCASIVAMLIVGASLFGNEEAMGKFGNVLPFWLDKTEFIPLYAILCGIGGIIIIGIPLFLLIRKGWNKGKNKPDLNKYSRRGLLVTWIIGMVILVFSIVKLCRINDVLQIHWDENNYNELVTRIFEPDSLIDKKNITNIEINEDGMKISDKEGKTIILNDGGITVRKEMEKTMTVQYDTIIKTPTETEITEGLIVKTDTLK